MAITRNYDNLSAYGPKKEWPLNGAHSLEIASDHAIRESASMTGWADVPSYRGRRLFIPPAGPGDLSTRLVVKDRRNDVDAGEIDYGGDVDGRSAELYVTPRQLAVP